MKPSASLYLLFNQFKNYSHDQKNEAENVFNSNFYDIVQFQTLESHEKNKSIYLYYINICSLSKTFDDLQHLIKCTNKAFDIVAVNETRITRKTALNFNINFQNYFFEFTPTESNARETSIYIANHLSYKLHTDLSLNKSKST